MVQLPPKGRRRVLLLGALAVALLVGCGSDDDGDGESPAGTTTVEEEQPEPPAGALGIDDPLLAEVAARLVDLDYDVAPVDHPSTGVEEEVRVEGDHISASLLAFRSIDGARRNAGQIENALNEPGLSGEGEIEWKGNLVAWHAEERPLTSAMKAEFENVAQALCEVVTEDLTGGEVPSGVCR